MKQEERLVSAVHGLQATAPDQEFEIELSAYLKKHFSRDALLDLLGRFTVGDDLFSRLIRRSIWRSLVTRFGQNVQIGSGVGITHPETFDIGHHVFIGAHAFIQGRFDGRCVFGDRVWIGPQCYFDARDLVVEEYVGWGPGSKVLGSSHTGQPVDIPVIQTDLLIKPVVVEAWADIGTNAVILPGVRIGKGSMVGAGSVVTKDIPPFAVAAGVPARFIRWRKDNETTGRLPGSSSDSAEFQEESQ